MARRKIRVEPPTTNALPAALARTLMEARLVAYNIKRHEDGGNVRGMPPESRSVWPRRLATCEKRAEEGGEAGAAFAEAAERIRTLMERGYGWRTSLAWAHDPRSWHNPERVPD